MRARSLRARVIAVPCVAAVAAVAVVAVSASADAVDSQIDQQELIDAPVPVLTPSPPPESQPPQEQPSGEGVDVPRDDTLPTVSMPSQESLIHPNG